MASTPSSPRSTFRTFRRGAVKEALTEPFGLVTVAAAAFAAAEVSRPAGAWLSGALGPAAAGSASAAGASALAGASGALLADLLLFRSRDNALILALPLPDGDLHDVRCDEVRLWGLPIAGVLAGAAAGAIGPLGAACVGAAALLSLQLGFAATVVARVAGLPLAAGAAGGAALAAWPGCAGALVLLGLGRPDLSPATPALVVAGLVAALVPAATSASRRAFERGGRRVAGLASAVRRRGALWATADRVLGWTPGPVRARLVLDLTLVLSGASARTALTAVLAASMLPFAARGLARVPVEDGALGWHLEWFRWWTAGSAVLAWGFGLDLVEARAPGLALDRVSPRRARPAFLAAATVVAAAVLAFGLALLAVARGSAPPYPPGRLVAELVIGAACLGHFAAAFGQLRFDGCRVAGAFAFLPGVVVIAVLLGLALHLHPLAGLLYFLALAGMAEQGRQAWERLEVRG